jgi:hypothetical protein
MALDTTPRTWHDVVTERGRVGDGVKQWPVTLCPPGCGSRSMCLDGGEHRDVLELVQLEDRWRHDVTPLTRGTVGLKMPA